MDLLGLILITSATPGPECRCWTWHRSLLPETNQQVLPDTACSGIVDNSWAAIRASGVSPQVLWRLRTTCLKTGKCRLPYVQNSSKNAHVLRAYPAERRSWVGIELFECQLLEWWGFYWKGFFHIPILLWIGNFTGFAYHPKSPG